MYIKSVTFIPVSDLADQFRAPNSMDVNQQHLNIIGEIIDESGTIDTGELSLALSDTITPDMSALEDVDISRGWDADRFRVLAEIVVDDISNYGDGQRVVLCGYTDRLDVSSSNEIADDTKIYLNSIITIRDMERTDRTGRTHVKSVVTSNNQLLTGRYDPRVKGGSDFVARPQDIFTTLTCLNDLPVDSLDDEDDTADTRIQFASGAKQSRRTNNMGGRFMAKLITADRDGLSESLSYGEDAFSGTRNSHAVSSSSEGTINANSVLYRLNMAAELDLDGCIEYQTLAVFTDNDSLDELDDLTRIGQRDMDTFDYHANELDSAYEETKIAVLVANAVPALLADYIMASIKFTCGNEDSINGTFEYDIIDSTCYVSGVANDDSLERGFMARFKKEVFDVISRNDRITVVLKVDSEVSGITRVHVAVGSGDWEEYVIPSFADSNLAPVITEQYGLIRSMATKYINVRNTVDALLDGDGDTGYDDDLNSDRGPTRFSERGILDLDDDL